jgi:uncharacterized protein YeaO (DUF488 family)
MLYTASFYAPEDWVGRAYRVSRQHPRGRKVQWESLPFLYPARNLIRAYRSGEIDFSTFSAEYVQGLEEKYKGLAEVQEWMDSRVGAHGRAPLLGDFTLLCFERAGQPCHRLMLAQWLLERVPSLEAGALR